MVSNWEAVKEGLKLMTHLLTRETTPRPDFASYIQFVMAIGMNTLHRGIIQHVHDCMLALLDAFFVSYPSSFIELIAQLTAQCSESTLPIIRRSGALPFILHSILTTLHHHCSSLLPLLVVQLIGWCDHVALPSLPVQSHEWTVYADAFQHVLTNTSHSTEEDRRRHLVHALNSITVCASSPDLASHFHPHLLHLLSTSLTLLDSQECFFPSLVTPSWNVKSATAQLLAVVVKRVFRARRSRGEDERINRVSSLAIAIEFPQLFSTLRDLLVRPTSGERCRFAVVACVWGDD